MRVAIATVSHETSTSADTIGPADFGYYLKMGGLGEDRMGIEHSWKHGFDLSYFGDQTDEVTV